MDLNSIRDLDLALNKPDQATPFDGASGVGIKVDDVRACRGIRQLGCLAQGQDAVIGIRNI